MSNDEDADPAPPDPGTGEDYGPGDAFHRHPLDSYKPLPKKRGCSKGCGCALAVAAVLGLLFVALVVAVGWLGPVRYVNQGYEVVRLEESSATVTQPPTRPTYYIGENIQFRFGRCTVPIVAAGSRIEVSGEFLEPASFTASRVTLTSAARFAVELEIYAFEFLDQGATLRGERTGRIYRELAP